MDDGVNGLLTALATAAVSLLLLVVAVLLAVRPLRRFARARAALRSDTAARLAALPVVVNPWRSRAE